MVSKEEEADDGVTEAVGAARAEDDAALATILQVRCGWARKKAVHDDGLNVVTTWSSRRLMRWHGQH